MSNHPDKIGEYVIPPRTQNDSLADAVSDITGVDFTDSDDKARQEFKQETDVNYILSRFGVNPSARQLIYGEQDYDLDLQRGLEALAAAKTAYNNLAPKLKIQYPTQEAFITALANGQFTNYITTEQEAMKPPQIVTPPLDITPPL